MKDFICVETFLFKQTLTAVKSEIWCSAAGEHLPAVAFWTPNKCQRTPMCRPPSPWFPPARQPAYLESQVAALAFQYWTLSGKEAGPCGCQPALKGATGDHGAAHSD